MKIDIMQENVVNKLRYGISEFVCKPANTEGPRLSGRTASGTIRLSGRSYSDLGFLEIHSKCHGCALKQTFTLN